MKIRVKGKESVATTETVVVEEPTAIEPVVEEVQESSTVLVQEQENKQDFRFVSTMEKIANLFKTVRVSPDQLAAFRFKPDGLQVRTKDEGNIGFLDFFLPKDCAFFEVDSYQCPQQIDVCLKPEDGVKLFAQIKPDLKFEVFKNTGNAGVDDEKNLVHFKNETDEWNLKTKEMIVDHQTNKSILDSNIKPFGYTTKTVFTIADISKKLEAHLLVAGAITFSVTKKSTKMTTKSSVGTGSTTFNHEGDDRVKGFSFTKEFEKFNVAFELKILSDLLKSGQSASNQFTIELDENSPAHVIYELPYGKLENYIAQRVV